MNERETVQGDFGGGAFELPTLVQIRMSGILSRYWAYGSIVGEPAGTYGPGGYWGDWDCKLNVVVLFSGGGGFAPCKGPHHPMQTVYTDTVVVRGVGSVKRNNDRTSYWLRRCGSSFGNTCHSYSGSQTVTVTPISDVLNLEASASRVDPGDVVTFTASTRGGGAFTVRQWIWVPERPREGEPAQQVVCENGAGCAHAVASRGTMYVSAVVSGRVEQASAQVSIDEPPFVVEIAEIHSEDAVVYPGTAVRFRARTTDGAAFQLLEWLWEPDDGPAGETIACGHTEDECTTAVYESGAMYARAEVGGVELSDGAHIEVEAARLTLDCAPAEVVRGGWVSCEASTEPAGAVLEVTGWIFKGGGEEVPRETTGTIWSGPLVTDGEVSVTALVGGRELTTSASVAVTPRPWIEYVPSSVEDRYIGCTLRTFDCLLLYPPVQFRDLGATEPLPRSFQLTERAEPIRAGPNAGWNYVGGTEEPVKLSVHIVYLNQIFLEPDHEFYRRKTECSPAQLRDWVRDHELVHVRIFDAEWPTRLVNAWLEQHVEFGSEERFRQNMERMERAVVQAIRESGDPGHSASYPHMPCPIDLAL